MHLIPQALLWFSTLEKTLVHNFDTSCDLWIIAGKTPGKKFDRKIMLRVIPRGKRGRFRITGGQMTCG